jgi:cytochrome c553
MKHNFFAVFIMMCFALWQSCSPADGNNTGHEYMPDMAHSIAVEANVDNYYFYHTWDGRDNYRKYASPLLPVKGTLARGAAGMASSSNLGTGEMSNNAIRTSNNGHVPYYYGNTEEERIRATKEITSNPFPITATGLASGKELYNIYCGICHGEKGDGNGYLVRDDGGLYPAQPANLLKDEFIGSNEGRLYHGIMYGKNVMMSYADKLSYQERWNVIHYMRSLQAASKGLKYTETENTFSGSQAVADAKKIAAAATVITTTTK